MAHIGNASNKALAITNAHVGSANGKAMPLIKGWMGNANNKAVPIWSKETGWVWQKYAINEITESGYREVAGASESKPKRNSFYVGDSYTLSQTTGQFSVNHNTPIKIAAAGATAAVGKYYTDDFHTSAETTTDGTTLYLITAANYSITGLKLTVTPYTAEAYSTTIQEKGDLLGTVTAADITAYPMNGVADDGYWYVLQNDIAGMAISYSGTYTDEVVSMDSGLYRLLTLTGSGTLTLEKAVKADIWLCGGGGGGTVGRGDYVPSLGMGGNGAYAAEAKSITLGSLSVMIGSAGASGSGSNYLSSPGGAGSVSSVSGTVELAANGAAKGSINSSVNSGTGGGGGNSNNETEINIACGYGDGLSKLPFDDGYFPASYCDGGGGGNYYDYDDNGKYSYMGGQGGTNGGNGGETRYRHQYDYSGGAGGGLFGGNGYGHGSAGAAATAGMGYGSGGGGAPYGRAAAAGYQGVCFIRIPLEQ